MIPYFHTNGGDYLLFESWTPLSSGGVAGASIVLFFIAILERLVNGVRGRLEGYWASK
jgi:copper transporter 1